MSCFAAFDRVTPATLSALSSPFGLCNSSRRIMHMSRTLHTVCSLLLLAWAAGCSSSTTTVRQATSGTGGSTATSTGGQVAGGASNVTSSSAATGGILAVGGTTALQSSATGGGPPIAGSGSTTQAGTSGGNPPSGGTSSAALGGAATGGSSQVILGGTGGSLTSTAGVAATGGAAIGGAATGGLGTVCTVGAAKCGGAETETTALKCQPDQNGYAVTAYCSDTGTQCNPSTGTCFALGIDATEVTRAQYSAFVAAGGVTQVPGCAIFNTSLAPDAQCMLEATVCQGTGCDSQPQVCVDWCDAYAYCEKQGKRLCGRISGGMNPFDRAADPGSSQWMNACSAGGQYKYGSGASVESGPAFCNYVGTQLGTTYAAGTHAGCTSPSPSYDEIFDLSGNVAEWEDSCEKPIDTVNLITGSDACRTRGGSFATPLSALSCDAVPAIALRRDGVAPDVGFRCCSK